MANPKPADQELELTGVESVQDLLALAELTEIRTYLLHGERSERDISEKALISVMARSEPTFLEARCRLTVGTDGTELVVERSAVFTFQQAVAVSEELVKEFVEKVGVMSVYPFLREGVFTLATNLGITPPVMALVRAGTVKLNTVISDPEGVEAPVKAKRSRSRKSE
jgi:hypothetical protein